MATSPVPPVTLLDEENKLIRPLYRKIGLCQILDAPTNAQLRDSSFRPNAGDYILKEGETVFDDLKYPGVVDELHWDRDGPNGAHFQTRANMIRRGFQDPDFEYELKSDGEPQVLARGMNRYRRLRRLCTSFVSLITPCIDPRSGNYFMAGVSVFDLPDALADPPASGLPRAPCLFATIPAGTPLSPADFRLLSDTPPRNHWLIAPARDMTVSQWRVLLNSLVPTPVDLLKAAADVGWNRFHRNDFKTVQPAACRLARALYYRLNEHDVDEFEQDDILDAIDAIRSGVFDVHAPIVSDSRELFVKSLRHFVDAEVALVDRADDYAYEAMVDEIRPFSALIEHYQSLVP